MALNYFLHRHQVSLVRAESSPTPEARYVHRKLTELYAFRVQEITAALGGGDLIAATVR